MAGDKQGGQTDLLLQSGLPLRIQEQLLLFPHVLFLEGDKPWADCRPQD